MEILNYGEQKWSFKDIEKDIVEFLRVYKERPIIDNQGGMISAHLFWAYYIMKMINPKYIVESGVFKGQGTWIFRKACPNATIISIDPNLDKRVYIDEKVKYFTDDFNMIDWNSLVNKKDTVCFFDDHQNAYRRLQEMKWIGFKKAIFEDNYPAKQGDCYSCKKILSESGFKAGGEYLIKPNNVHSRLFKENVKSYTTMPPIFKNKFTRWEDEWEDENYKTPTPLFEQDYKKDEEEWDILMKEAYGYTWICYVELK